MDEALLIRHIRKQSRPLTPLPTQEEPRTVQLTGLKAVVFDIYGTLFISGSGDISLAQAEDRSPAIVAALESAGFTIRDPEAPWADRFFEILEDFRHRRRRDGVEFPEVRIEEVWEALLASARQSAWIEGSGDVQLAIVDNECRVNPCWPMPGLAAVLEQLKARNLAMGIVSNAQFYTPLLFPALLDREMEDCGLQSALSVWSYREREGKPSVNLYKKLAAALLDKDIRPEETLYIGNDIRNDIQPAALAGFRTALFAGDSRSLRWRNEDPSCRATRPDRVITGLSQVLEIIQ